MLAFLCPIGGITRPVNVVDWATRNAGLSRRTTEVGPSASPDLASNQVQQQVDICFSDHSFREEARGSTELV